MKQKRYIYGIVGCLLISMMLGISSCDGLEDELFQKNSYIVHNGWQDYALEVAEDNTTILPIYFGVNGTSANDKDICLTMEIDPDTLQKYNWEKYKNQSDLYYKILPAGTYTFDADSWTIPSGELNATAAIKIDLNKIEELGSLYDDYVLPLRITSSTGEPMGQNKYTKSESKITFNDIQDALVLVSNNFSTQTSYENQTKKAINNKFVQEAMTDFLRAQLEVYFIENPQDAQRIAEQVLINKRSRETAERTRLNIKKKLSGSMDISNRVQKFVPCRTKDIERSELYIVEGDSALGSVKLARDGEFQAIMPIRGKILNCLKADYGKIFKSDIITDLLKVLGCGVEVHDKRAKDLATFDLANLRWNKIVICTDADVDGFQIRTLVLTMLYRLTPTLIQQGYVYIAESPLYEITCKEKTWFAYSDKEKNDIVATLEGKKYDIQRSKGLGENEPDMMWLTTMNPATRRLIKVMPEDVERTAQVFDLLLGENAQGRKEHIAENGYKYLDLADIS